MWQYVGRMKQRPGPKFDRKMDGHGENTVQTRAREVEHRRNALSGTQGKERGIYVSWTSNCPVAVCQGKRGPFVSSTGQNTDTRA